jgi:hypothetical protein
MTFASPFMMTLRQADWADGHYTNSARTPTKWE